MKDKTFEELYDEMLDAKDNYWRLKNEIKKLDAELTVAESVYMEANDAYLNKIGEYGKNANT